MQKEEIHSVGLLTLSCGLMAFGTRSETIPEHMAIKPMNDRGEPCTLIVPFVLFTAMAKGGNATRQQQSSGEKPNKLRMLPRSHPENAL